MYPSRLIRVQYLFNIWLQKKMIRFISNAEHWILKLQSWFGFSSWMLVAQLTCCVACVASVSMRFRSKERGKRVKDRAKNGASKRATFIFWLLFHFSRGQNRESRSSVFLCSETKRKRLLRRLDVVYFSTMLCAQFSRMRDHVKCWEFKLNY